MPGNFVDKFLLACRSAGLSDRTVDWYASNLQAFHLSVSDFTVDEVRRYVAGLFVAGYSPFSVAGHVRTLKRYFSWCVAEGLFVSDPTVRVPIPRLPVRVPRGVSLDDFRKLFLACDTDRDRAVLLFLVDTGCRVSELSGVRLSDLDLDKGVCLVRGKGSQERFLFLSLPTLEALRVWLSVRDSSTDCLFVTRRGKQFSRFTVKELLRRLKHAAGVTGRCNAHSFRHGFAREYLLSGGDLASLCDLLGHKDISTTKIYASFAQGDLQNKHSQHSPINKLFGS